jgi:hypothetical protein
LKTYWSLATLPAWIVLFVATASLAQTENINTEDLHDELAEHVNSLANYIDSYFGQIRADDERSGSTLRIAPQFVVGEFATPQASVDTRVNLRLKNFERLGQNIVDRMFNYEDPEDKPLEEELNSQGKAPEGWTRNIEAHSAGIAPPTYGILVRFRRNWQRETWIHRFYWSTGWSSDSLWQSDANFSSDHALSKEVLFRWFNQWSYNLSSSLQTTSHGPSIYHTLSEKLSISYDARVNYAVESSAIVLDDYSLGTSLRRRLNRKWIFLEIDPSVSFGRIHQFQRQLNILAKIEFVFGDL